MLLFHRLQNRGATNLLQRISPKSAIYYPFKYISDLLDTLVCAHHGDKCHGVKCKGRTEFIISVPTSLLCSKKSNKKLLPFKVPNFPISDASKRWYSLIHLQTG